MKQAYEVVWAGDGIEVRRYVGSLGFQVWADGAFRYFTLELPAWTR